MDGLVIGNLAHFLSLFRFLVPDVCLSSIAYIDNCPPLVVLENEKGDSLISCTDNKLCVTDRHGQIITMVSIE